jgi:nucleoside-diphosphate-sugar epimerase
MKNVVITGSNGFIGGALTRKMLQLNYHVIGIITSKDGMDDVFLNKNFTPILITSFADYNRLHELINTNVDYVFHFAWRGLCGNDAKNVDYQLENIDATITLFNEMIRLNMKKFVFASTMNTLDVQHFLNDPTHVEPRPAYIHSGAKLITELYLKTLAKEHNVEINVGYIAMAFGPKNYSKMVPNIVISKLLKNEPVNLIEGNNDYDLIYIDDIVNGFIAILSKGINMKSYYIGHIENKTFKELFIEIAKILNKNAILNFGFYKDNSSIDFSLINRKELFQDTGWKASSNFKDSILKTAQWIKDNHVEF